MHLRCDVEGYLDDVEHTLTQHQGERARLLIGEECHTLHDCLEASALHANVFEQRDGCLLRLSTGELVSHCPHSVPGSVVRAVDCDHKVFVRLLLVIPKPLPVGLVTLHLGLPH